MQIDRIAEFMQKLWIYSAQPIGGRKKGAFGGSFSFSREEKQNYLAIQFILLAENRFMDFPLYFQFCSVFTLCIYFISHRISRIMKILKLQILAFVDFFHSKNTLVSHSVVTSSH